MGCCSTNKGCCMGECAGRCDRDTIIDELSLNTIVELEVHYTESEENGKVIYVLENLYCLTNIQARELLLTGLEGSKYDDMEKMRQHILDVLEQKGAHASGALKAADIVYIREDV